MASIFLPRLTSRIGLGLFTSTLAASSLKYYNRSYRSPLLLDSFTTSRRQAITSPHIPRPAFLTPDTIKNLTTGSILGLVSGLAISTFSKPLTIILGLVIVLVQTLESNGIHVLPYAKGYFLKNGAGDVWRKWIGENVAFKLAFGTAFALSGFAEF